MLAIKETGVDDLREVILDVSLAPQDELEDEPGLPGVTVVTYLANPGEEEEEEEEESNDK